MRHLLGNSCSRAGTRLYWLAISARASVSKAERGILKIGHLRNSIVYAQACALERSLRCCCSSDRNNMEDSSYGL